MSVTAEDFTLDSYDSETERSLGLVGTYGGAEISEEVWQECECMQKNGWKGSKYRWHKNLSSAAYGDDGESNPICLTTDGF